MTKYDGMQFYYQYDKIFDSKPILVLEQWDIGDEKIETRIY